VTVDSTEAQDVILEADRTRIPVKGAEMVLGDPHNFAQQEEGRMPGPEALH